MVWYSKTGSPAASLSRGAKLQQAHGLLHLPFVEACCSTLQGLGKPKAALNTVEGAVGADHLHCLLRLKRFGFLIKRDESFASSALNRFLMCALGQCLPAAIGLQMRSGALNLQSQRYRGLEACVHKILLNFSSHKDGAEERASKSKLPIHEHRKCDGCSALLHGGLMRKHDLVPIGAGAA